jgi:hypothetical protein
MQATPWTKVNLGYYLSWTVDRQVRMIDLLGSASAPSWSAH